MNPFKGSENKPIMENTNPTATGEENTFSSGHAPQICTLGGLEA